MATFKNALEELRRDGFVIIESFFDPSEPKAALGEILAVRESLPEGVTVGKLGASTEVLSNLYGTCPTLDQMVGRILGDPASRAFLAEVAGPHLKNRDYTCRLMTGDPDEGSGYNPPLEWHRDSKGEFIVGIYLTDVPEGENSATAFLPGSYRYPYDPRWGALLGKPFYLGNDRMQRKFGQWRGLGVFLKLNPFGRMLGRRVTQNATGAFGKAGDWYLFINDTWHGRLPNRNGMKVAVIQLGFFPVEFPFPDTPKPVPPEIKARLPEAFRNALEPAGQNPAGKALVYEVIASQAPARFPDLFWWARLERRIAEAISAPLVLPFTFAKAAARRLLRR